jgi:hypothetical protein
MPRRATRDRAHRIALPLVASGCPKVASFLSPTVLAVLNRLKKSQTTV